MKAAAAAAEKGIHVNIVGMGDPKGSPIPVDGSNNYMKDKDGNVVITKLNEEMCQEIAAAGHGTYVRADNTNSALRALQKEIDKMKPIFSDLLTIIQEAVSVATGDVGQGEH